MIDAEQYFPLIHKLVNQSRPILHALHIEYEDAFQIGAVGLVVAMREHKPEKGSFCNFAAFKIHNELVHYFRKLNMKKRKCKTVPIDKEFTDNADMNTILPDPLSDLSFDNILTDFDVNILASKIHPRERKVLNLMYSHNVKSRVEIMKRLGLSETAVYRRIQKLQKAALEILDIKKGSTPMMSSCKIKNCQRYFTTA